VNSPSRRASASTPCGVSGISMHTTDPLSPFTENGRSGEKERLHIEAGQLISSVVKKQLAYELVETTM